MLRKLLKKVVDAFCGKESIDCPKCKKSKAIFSHAWGRQSVYKCNKCGSQTSIKTLD